MRNRERVAISISNGQSNSEKKSMKLVDEQ